MFSMDRFSPVYVTVMILIEDVLTALFTAPEPFIKTILKIETGGEFELHFCFRIRPDIVSS